MHRLEELVRLHRMKTGTRETARLLRMSPNTERRYREALVAEGLLEGPVEEIPPLETLKSAVLKHHPPAALPPQQTTSLEPYREAIATLLDKGLGPRAVYDRLRMDHGDLGASYSALKRLARTLRRGRGVRPEDVAIPVDTEAGEIAQVDFGYVGKLFDPSSMTLRKAWAFVLVLGYSRHMVVRVAFDQRVETWLRLHVEAFEELGGVVRTVVPDNLKAAVVRAAFEIDGGTELNRSYRELARHYGFKIDPAPPRQPKKKGKVEAGVKYAKGNFFSGRAESDVDVLRPELARWVREVAGQRVHGTTGRRPLEVFEDVERASLLPLPPRRFEPVVWKKARVHSDAHVAFGRRLYSVPWTLLHAEVWVRASAHSVEIYAADERVATHARQTTGLRSTLESHLPEHRGALRHRSRLHWEERASRMGEEVVGFIREVFDQDDVLSQLRTVQAIVTHLETFPPERARAACERARHFGGYGYKTIKNILRLALDLQPLPPPSSPTVAPANDIPRFARPPRLWAERLQEKSCESLG